MGLNIGQPLSSGLLSITNKGLIANNNTIYTGSFTIVSSSSEIIYAYDKDDKIITGYYAPGNQTQSILWINDGTGGDGKLRWDLIAYATVNHISGSELVDPDTDGWVTRYYLSTEHNSIPHPVGNNTYGTDDSYIFDIAPYTIVPILYQPYNQYTFNTGSGGPDFHEIEINGFDPSTGSINSSYDAIIFTIPNTGSYAFTGLNTASFSYASNTCSISFKETGRYTAPGITDYSTGSLIQATKYFNGYVLFVSSSVFASTASLEGGLIKAPMTGSIYYTSASVGEFTNGYFELSGDQRNYFKAGTVIDVGGYSLLVNGATYNTTDGDYIEPPGALSLGNKTRVYTMTYPFTGSVYYPVDVSLGVNSYVLGYGNVGYNGPQLTLGTYNTDNSYDKYLVIGNGTSTASRSDIFSVSRNSVSIGGTLIVTGSITGSLFGTASWATSASRAISSSQATSASIAVSASNVLISSTNTNGTYYLHFGNQTSGYDNVEVDTQLNYNPSANQLSISGSMILSASAPVATPGGIYYDGTHFYLGF